MERIYNAFDKEEPLGLTLLVLSKAFDVVSHGILHEKSYLKVGGGNWWLSGTPHSVSYLLTTVNPRAL